MPTSEFLRTTQSGACAFCGTYRETQHPSSCHPRSGPRLKLAQMRHARRDARNSTAIRGKMRIDNELVRYL